jgi:protein TonB
MFETTVVESRRQKPSRQSTMLLPVSVALHATALAAAILAAVWDTDFPRVPPGQVVLLNTTELPAVPPAPPPGPKRPVNTTPVKPLTIPDNAAPSEVPDEIPTEIASNPLPGAVEGSVDDGGGGGEQGVVGGVGDPNSVATEDPAPPEQIYTPGGDVKPPVIISRIEPDYPALMIKIRKPGRVVVQCVISRDGSIQRIAVVDATNQLFADAAVAAVQRWRFKPGTLNGRPVDVMYHLTVGFSVK